jgi:AcrR family transcriptional regulator
MVRIVKEKAYAARRNEILDVATQLVYTKGYEQMSIQDICETLNISKGAFYHYFDSKPALLEALIERMLDEAELLIAPILQDPDLSALEKLRRYFETAVRWKTAQKTYLLSLMHIWYADDNAIIRQKMFAKTIKRIAPMFAGVIHQGIQEGVLATPYPDQATEVILYLMQGLGDRFVELLISYEMESANAHLADSLRSIEIAVAAYTDALERVLGAPANSLQLMDDDAIKAWITG